MYKETKASLVTRDGSSVENGPLQLTIHTCISRVIPGVTGPGLVVPSLLFIVALIEGGDDRALSQGRRQFREGHCTLNPQRRGTFHPGVLEMV